MKRGTASRVFFGVDKTNEDFGGLLLLSQVTLGKKSGMFDEHKGLCIVDNVLLGKGIARVISVIIRGTSPLVLPDAIADSLSYVKAFGGTEQRNLPDNYLQRQFIYMMDGSYIKVEDLLISAGYRVEFDFQTLTLGSPLRNFIGGRANGVSAGGGFRLSKLASGGTSLNRVVLYGFEAGTEYYDPTTQFQPDTRYKYTYNNGVCTLESGGSVVSTKTFSVTDTTSTKWGINTYVSGNDYWQTETNGIYVYSLKVWNDQGELVMDLVPAVQKAAVPVVGFYDRATGGFRTPSAGTFAAGGEAVPTPDTPMDIVSNNGVLTFTPNLLDMASENIVLGKYINNSGVITDSGPNFYNSKYIPVVAGGVYTRSTSSSINYFSVMEYDSNYVFTKRTLFSNAGTSGSITLRSDTAFVLIGSNMDGTDTTIDKVAAVDWQFEKGSSATAYKPYSPTGIYTDGTVETINVHGKNLFDPTKVLFGYYRDRTTGDKTQNSSNFMSSDDGYIPCLPNTTYTFVGTNKTNGTYSKYNTIYFFDSAKNYLGASPYEISQPTTGTTPNNCYYLQVRSNPLDNSTPIQDAFAQFNWQLERGSTVTTYAPYYDGGTATAEMLLKVGNYQDVQSIIDGVVTRNVSVKVLDGTEAWGFASNLLYLPLADYDTQNTYASYCTHYQSLTPSTNINIYNSAIRVGTTTIGSWSNRIAIKDSTYADATTFKSFLADQYAAGTPVIIVYPLDIATTESITAQTMQVQEGNNTLEITQASMTGLELEAQYQKRT